MKSRPLVLEELESRRVPSVAHPTPVGGSTPAQVSHAYGFDQVSANGSGQTIAIVDAYDDPNIQSDLHVFDQQFGLPDPPSFVKVNERGSKSGPFPAVSSLWSTETALDVEWAHAIAPGANILLVESSTTNIADWAVALDTARSWSGVSVVSLSWGYSEGRGELSYDSHLTTPANHTGVTFVAASGDSGGQAVLYWPAVSPNALAVGGTTLTMAADGTWSAEVGWSGSTGGLSGYESQPSYQSGVVTQSSTRRAVPDVAYAADSSNPGYAWYDSVLGQGSPSGWGVTGGTSEGAPQWAALVARADQLRAGQNVTPLDGFSQTLPALYAMAKGSSSYFHDITSGGPGTGASAGYDLVTGLGSPLAQQIIPALAGVTGSGASVRLPAASGTSFATGNGGAFDVQAAAAEGAPDGLASGAEAGAETTSGGGPVGGTAVLDAELLNAGLAGRTTPSAHSADSAVARPEASTTHAVLPATQTGVGDDLVRLSRPSPTKEGLDARDSSAQEQPAEVWEDIALDSRTWDLAPLP